jgi:hypothetical protein
VRIGDKTAANSTQGSHHFPCGSGPRSTAVVRPLHGNIYDF